jgi:MFS transporter, DHA2 family, multidrug resistance protein
MSVAIPDAPPRGNPWAIAVLVALATFMEVLDTTIANVALPHIAGGTGVSEDEASWVLTTYLVANAITLTASSFLTKLWGRRRFFLICLGLFTVSSVLCGLSWNLPMLLLFRILQGLGGGGMVPVSQSILADAFPPEKRGQGFALFGVAVVVAPVVGPVLGGWLSDNWSWHWCFLINGPVGVLTMALISAILTDPGHAAQEHRQPFDLVGFVLVATFLSALEVMLDRGQQDDWFSSSFIVAFAVITGLAFVAMLPWEMTRRAPIIDIRMVASRQFGSAFIVRFAAGAILFATTQFVPQLVQQCFGYTATLAGLVLTPGGLITFVMLGVVGRLSGRVQPRYLIAVGAAVSATAMLQMTEISGATSFWFFADARLLASVALPLIVLPSITVSYDGLRPGQTDQASALTNAARNVGGSVGISLANNVLADREQFHQSRLVERVIPSGAAYQHTLHQATQYFLQQGSSLLNAQHQAFAWIGQQVQTQAVFLAYIDVFWVLALISLALVPLAFILRKVSRDATTPAGH